MENNHETLKRMKFDLVVVDEAHHMNSSGKKASVRYKLGMTLSKITTHLLFLTATPHRGKPNNFRLLLKLLDETQFAENLTPEEVATRKTQYFLRHLKTDMTDMDGNQIFPKRRIRSLEYRMSKPEKVMYDLVSNYVGEQSRLLENMGERFAPFVLMLIQRRMASSTHALQKTLEHRRQKLKDKFEGKSEPDTHHIPPEPDDELDPEHERWNDMLTGISASRTPEELEVEIKQLDGLVDAAYQTANTKPDRKLEKLLDIINRLDGKKLLIFSEFTDTLDYLEGNLDVQTCRIDGNMKQEQRDTAVQEFRDSHNIMLATDAAREGINLQFCHIMVNYDLPWSPIVLEQRMGRLHRYGQKEDVEIHNMVAADTIERDVLERLSDKIEKIQEQYQSVDVIGAILPEVDINQIMKERIMGRATADMEQDIEQTKEMLEVAKKMLDSTSVDRDAARRKQDQILAKHVDGKYLERMMHTIFEGLGGRLTSTKLRVPDELRHIFRKKWIRIDATTLARGTKYYKMMEEWVMNNCMADLRGGSVFIGDDPGHIIFHTTELKNIAGDINEVLVQAHYVADGGKKQRIHPDTLYTLEDVGGDPGKKPDTYSITGIANDEAQARADEINDEKQKFWERRIKQADDATKLQKLQDELGEMRMGTPERREMAARIERSKKSQQNMRERAESDRLYVEETENGWLGQGCAAQGKTKHRDARYERIHGQRTKGRVGTPRRVKQTRYRI